MSSRSGRATRCDPRLARRVDSPSTSSERLHLEAAQTRVVEATQRHGAASARLLIAEQQAYADNDERQWVRAFWAAVSAVAELRERDQARTEASATFKAQREQARRALVSVGDTDALADLLALPTFDPHFVQGAVVALAIRKAFGADSSDRAWNELQQLPLRIPLENLPALEAGRESR